MFAFRGKSTQGRKRLGELGLFILEKALGPFCACKKKTGEGLWTKNVERQEREERIPTASGQGWMGFWEKFPGWEDVEGLGWNSERS